MKPLVTYTMRRKKDDRDLYNELAIFLEHVPGFGVDVKSIQFFSNGNVEINTLGTVPADQLEHVGIEPTSEVKREI